MEEEHHAVACGYWPLYRYNPKLAEAGKNPLTVDYKQPDGTMPAFLSGEDRYAYLSAILPNDAKVLNTALQKECDSEYRTLARESSLL